MQDSKATPLRRNCLAMRAEEHPVEICLTWPITNSLRANNLFVVPNGMSHVFLQITLSDWSRFRVAYLASTTNSFDSSEKNNKERSISGLSSDR
jgi:hypothetical protein